MILTLYTYLSSGVFKFKSSLRVYWIIKGNEGNELSYRVSASEGRPTERRRVLKADNVLYGGFVYSVY